MLEPERLLDWFRDHSAAVVAFSGGLDSSVVAKAATMALGENVWAVMAVSPTCFKNEVEEARAVAGYIGIRFAVLESGEMDDPAFTANDPRRCYHCKRIRFGDIRRFATERNIDLVADGSNADDRNDYRPGSRAALEWKVRSPLSELELGKETIRELARFWHLPNSEKPALPCLATRFAYGLEITPAQLRQVERAEQFLISQGFSPVRVRLHPDGLVRIEVVPDQLDRLWTQEIRGQIVEEFLEIGFHFISVDLRGFRSGSMNHPGADAGEP